MGKMMKMMQGGGAKQMMEMMKKEVSQKCNYEDIRWKKYCK